MIFYLLSLTLLVAATAAVDWRIIGGSTATAGQFPQQISLQYSGSHMCGGTIIHKQWVLTAAHCVDGYPASSFTVVVGTNKLSEGGETYAVDQIKVHEDYDYIDILNDIAIIRIEKPIVFNEKVQPMPLNTEDIDGGEDMVLCGWGSTQLGGSLPNDLQFIELKSIAIEECKQLQNPFVVTDGMICTFTKRGEGACHGDSGSSLVFDGRVTGIVSWGRPCANGYPDVFTRVSKYAVWIKSKMDS